MYFVYLCPSFPNRILKILKNRNMKKLVLSTVAMLSLGVFAYAQPNAGFETWQSVTGQTTYEDPTNWTTTNVLNQFIFGANPVSVFKASGVDKYSGTFACKITIIKQTNNQTGGTLPDTLGLIYTGTIGLQGPKYGYTYGSRPVSLDFMAKYTPTGTDTAAVYVLLTKWNTNKRDTVGAGGMVIGSASSFTSYSAPIVYKQSYNPDTATIIITAGGGSIKKAKTPKVGSALYVDDLSWIVTGINENIGIANIVSVYPNPASDVVNFKAASNDAREISIVDITGRNIGNYTFENMNVRVATSGLATGMYSYSVLGKNGEVLSRGMFDVAR